MNSFLLVLPEKHPNQGHGFILAAAEKALLTLEGIERLSINVYILPESTVLAAVSAIAVALKAVSGDRSQPFYGYKILPIPEDARWLCFDSSQQPLE